MLILTRNINESLMIGDKIKITILSNNKCNQVRGEVEAPNDFLTEHKNYCFLEL